MNNTNKVYCPSSQDFLYWAPESIADYEHWCEIDESEQIQTHLATETDKKSPQSNLNL
ncbi:hypothetical protein [sulfur-oxidizing endosymbiont of Gigantopelta aegis]|uniref:hypothetical protein n=1 Tax=sulfur-oxidizing endosymbiont of Gigantopelta aegis TaxID=2794934 RepID=UPI001BE3F603|nr:hypothetical protein [sulfur-oxidizing endosymbiont of Gigantopelta aegis]